MVPLHNLTSNTYVLQVGDDFIWAEFTKTSLVDHWVAEDLDRPVRSGRSVAFEKRKTNKSLADYVNGAQRGHKVLQPGLSYWRLQNAVPETIRKAYDLAEDAKSSAAAAEDRLSVVQTMIRGFGAIAVIGVLLGLGAIVQATWTSQQTTQSMVDTTNERVRDQNARVKELEREVRELKTQMKQPAPAPKDRPGG
jgi:hypothetical protein